MSGMVDTMHVVPVGDLVEHETTADCVCGPATEAVFREDGSNGWLVVHHSLDGREAFEALGVAEGEVAL